MPARRTTPLADTDASFHMALSLLEQLGEDVKVLRNRSHDIANSQMKVELKHEVTAKTVDRLAATLDNALNSPNGSALGRAIELRQDQFEARLKIGEAEINAIGSYITEHRAAIKTLRAMAFLFTGGSLVGATAALIAAGSTLGVW